jgi:hypothetical protein
MEGQWAYFAQKERISNIPVPLYVSDETRGISFSGLLGL